MTCICWDGHQLAADRRSAGNGPICIVTKIRRGSDGRLVGAAGNTSACQALMAWIAAGEQGEPPLPIESDKWTEMLMIAGDGGIWIWGDHGRFQIHNTQIAIGSGAQYALGAMACGKTAAEAIAIAALYDHCTGADADTLTLEPVAQPRRRGKLAAV